MSDQILIVISELNNNWNKLALNKSRIENKIGLPPNQPVVPGENHATSLTQQAHVSEYTGR